MREKHINAVPLAMVVLAASLVIKLLSASNVMGQSLEFMSTLIHPIELHGRVLDSNNDPVPDVTVKMTWNTDNQTGSEEVIQHTDAKGEFFLTGKKGNVLVVGLAKQGYRPRNDLNQFAFCSTFETSDSHRATKIGDVFLFHMQQVHDSADIVHRRKAYQPQWREPTLEIDLITGKESSLGKGDLSFNYSQGGREPGTSSYDWNCQIAVRDGGIIEAASDYEQSAPAEGYKPTYVVNMVADLKPYSKIVSKTFFVKFRQPAMYALLQIKFVSGRQPLYSVESSINTMGEPLIN